MSNLSSKFDVLSGRMPRGKSALEYNLKQKNGESPVLTEGKIAKVANESGVGVFTALTSAGMPSATNLVAMDMPWLIIEGMDQTDSQTANSMTALSIRSGIVFKVATSVSFTVGDLAFSNAGSVDKVASGTSKQAIGQVIEVNTTGGTVTIAA